MTHTLYISLRSPFARRVRLALEELGVEYTTEVIDVFHPPLGFKNVNPLGRVPVLVTPQGSAIIDSWMILDYLKARHSTHPLFLFGPANEARMRSHSAIAVGVMEHTVAAYLEKLRGPGVMSQAHFNEAVEVVSAGLAALERHAAARNGQWMSGDTLRQCDLDVGAALAYVELRLPGALARNLSLRALLERLNRRESFKKTVPPA